MHLRLIWLMLSIGLLVVVNGAPNWEKNRRHESVFLVDVQVPEEDNHGIHIDGLVKILIPHMEETISFKLEKSRVCLVVFFPPLDSNYGNKVKYSKRSHFRDKNRQDSILEYATERYHGNLSEKDEMKQADDKRFGIESRRAYWSSCWKPIASGYPALRLSIRKVPDNDTHPWEDLVNEKILPYFKDSKPGLLVVTNSYYTRRPALSRRHRFIIYEVANGSTPKQLWRSNTAQYISFRTLSRKMLVEVTNIFRKRLDSCLFEEIEEEACYWTRQWENGTSFDCQQRTSRKPHLPVDNRNYAFCLKAQSYDDSPLCDNGTMCEKVCQHFMHPLPCNVSCGKGVRKEYWRDVFNDPLYDDTYLELCSHYHDQRWVTCIEPDCPIDVWVISLVGSSLTLLVIVLIAAPIVIYCLFYKKKKSPPPRMEKKRKEKKEADASLKEAVEIAIATALSPPNTLKVESKPKSGSIALKSLSSQSKKESSMKSGSIAPKSSSSQSKKEPIAMKTSCSKNGLTSVKAGCQVVKKSSVRSVNVISKAKK